MKVIPTEGTSGIKEKHPSSIPEERSKTVVKPSERNH